MDEITAALTNLAVLDSHDRKNFEEYELVEADRVYAVNNNLDNATAIVMGYKTTEQEEAELDELNTLAIAALMEEDLKEQERSRVLNVSNSHIMIEGVPRRTNSLNVRQKDILAHEESLFEASKGTRPTMNLSQIEETLSCYKHDTILIDIVGRVLMKGTDMEIVAIEVQYMGGYKITLHVLYSSTLSMNEEASIVSQMDSQYKWALSFTQSFVHAKRKHRIEIKAFPPVEEKTT